MAHPDRPHNYSTSPIGPDGCAWCCDRCNLDTHMCGGCGMPLAHDGTERDTQLEHDCESEDWL